MTSIELQNRKRKKKIFIKVDDIFNSWKVLSLEASSKQKCLCICIACNETIKEMRKHFLTGSRSKSCGCNALNYRKETMKDLYGANFYTETEIFKKQKAETNLEKYNTLHPSATPEIKAKIRQTFMDIYNVSHPSKLSSTRDKIRKSKIEKYGTTSTQKIKKILYPDSMFRTEDGRYLIDICRAHGKNVENAYRVYHKFGEKAFLEYCKNNLKESSLETAFRLLLQDKFPDLKKFDKKPSHIKINRRPDFFLKTNNKKLYVNIDGLYGHSSPQRKNNYHKELREEFEKNNSLIMQFRQDELISKPLIIRSIIYDYFNFNFNHTKIVAKKCLVRRVNNDKAKIFLEENNLMGHLISATYYGLFFEDNLVAIIGVKSRKSNLEIVRYCSKIEYRIQDGLPKMLKHLIEVYNPSKLISYVDLRYATGSSYEKLGFIQEKISLCWQWTDFKNTFSRSRCKANMDDRNLTEEQYAAELGWSRIYDAGQAKYIKSLKEM